MTTRGRTKVALLAELRRRSDLVRRQARELRRSERAARQAEEACAALERRNRELEAAHRDLKDLDAIKSRFFTNVSHELRTPLALILGPVERIIEGGTPLPPESLLENLGVVRRNARVLLNHVNDILDLAKIDAGEMSARYTRTDLGRLVRFVASHFDAAAAAREIAYRIEGPAELPCETDQEKLAGALFNVLGNAFKFVPAGGGVRCVLGESAGRATIAVEDDGPGIPEESLEEIFGRFRQPSHAPRSGGSGLGLAIARELLGLLGGTITARNRPEGGAVFQIGVPLRAPPGTVILPDTGLDAAGLRALVEEPRAHDGAPEPRSGRATVLVVEDNAEMRRFVAATLEGQYRIVVARDGHEGLEMALAEVPDLVVTDVMMPRVGGELLLRRIREHRRTSDVPVVVLTARAEPGLVTQLLEAGAQDYVVKPFSAAELRARVGNLVSMGRARAILRLAVESKSGEVDALASELARKARELEQAYQEVDVARKFAERSSRLRSSFLNMLSHEVRTPVSVLQLQMEVLKKSMGSAIGPRELGVLDRVAGAARRLMDLVEVVLEYSRVESGRLEVNAESFEVAPLVEGAVRDLSAHAGRKGLRLEASCSPGIPPLVADPRLLRLLLVNLVNNAIKFTERGSVRVESDHAGGEHLLRVIDSGPGIAPEDQATIFEPFEQLASVRHKHVAGVGLGLALVRELTEALGWGIRLTSEPGRGSTFTLAVPSGGASRSAGGSRPASEGARSPTS